MENKGKFQNRNPRESANILNILLFWWLKPLFFAKFPTGLTANDLYHVPTDDVSQNLGDKLEKYWKEELDRAQTKGERPRLLYAMIRIHYRSFIACGVQMFVVDIVLKIVQRGILKNVIMYFTLPETTKREVYIFASEMVIVSVLVIVIECYAHFELMHIGQKLRVSTCSLIYRKSMRLPGLLCNEATQARALVLMSNDVARFENVLPCLHYVWIVPIQLVLVNYMVYQIVGMASVFGVLFLVLEYVVVHGFLGFLNSKLRMKTAIRTDERLRVVNEVVRGMKLIKMYAWETFFADLVFQARRCEMKVITWISYIRAYNAATFEITDKVALFLIIFAHTMEGSKLTVGQVFTIIPFVNMLKISLSIFLPIGVSRTSEALVSIQRIQEFLLLEENKKIEETTLTEQETNIDIKVDHVYASWTENSGNVFNDINFSMNKGELYAIVGPVASGKSSFLKLVLRELPILRGRVHINGEVSYASQEPWLFPGTLRMNIIFGETFHEEKYNKVVKACALNRVFAQLPHGDSTFVGEEGAFLSRGQRARVNLARAVYRDASIYLLDDPLFAVDSQIGKALFDKCITGYLHSKTVLIVTNQVQYLREIKNIIYLRKGEFAKVGTFAEIVQDFSDFFESTSILTFQENDDSLHKYHNYEENDFLRIEKDHADVEEEPEETEELIPKGSMSKDLFWKYYRAGASTWYLLFLILIVIVVQLFASGAYLWLLYWIRLENSHVENTTTPAHYENNSLLFSNNSAKMTQEMHSLKPSQLAEDYGLLIFAILVFTMVVLCLFKNLMSFKVYVNSSRKLHDSMFSNLLRAPMRFFDLNSAGCILNRFSKDTGCLDEFLPHFITYTLQLVTIALGLIILMSIMNFWIIIPIAGIGCIFWLSIDVYVTTARDVWRLETVGKNLVLSHLNSSLSGLVTIRSHKAEEVVCSEFDSRQDIHSQAYFISIASAEAFQMWLDLFSAAFVCVVTFTLITLKEGHQITWLGDVTFSLSQINYLCTVLQWGSFMFCDSLTRMISVERIQQFTQIENEKESGSRLPHGSLKGWPSRGRLEFRGVTLRYTKSARPALYKLNFSIQAGEKIGIVGHSGAGKSSIVSALFRLTDFEGKIFLDGIDISEPSLKDLRTKMSTIPQDPMLFCRTLRDNVDPFREYDDEDIWAALEVVGLKNIIHGLDHHVLENGRNFSSGQKQLICLVRAILRKNKVLILDEATANVDPKMEALIKKTLEAMFQSCTVLTIAHRLQTIMNSDKILVLHEGEIVEFDRPTNLLQRNDSYFRKLVFETGGYVNI